MLGRNVVARSTSREHWRAVLGHMGVPEASIAHYEKMTDGINSGWIDHGIPGAEHVAGMTTPAQVLARSRTAEPRLP